MSELNYSENVKHFNTNITVYLFAERTKLWKQNLMKYHFIIVVVAAGLTIFLRGKHTGKRLSQNIGKNCENKQNEKIEFNSYITYCRLILYIFNNMMK